jgi:hypothetical protein
MSMVAGTNSSSTDTLRSVSPCLDLVAALGDAVAPEILAHHLLGRAGLGDQPRQGHHQSVDVEQVDHRERLRLQERLVDAGREPGMLLDQRLADADEMHDRKQAGLLEVGPLGRADVWKQPLDMRLFLEEGRRRARREQRVEFAVA